MVEQVDTTIFAVFPVLTQMWSGTAGCKSQPTYFILKEMNAMNKGITLLKLILWIIAIIVALGIVCSLTGCNRQMIDLDYTFNYAIINLGGEYKEIEIKSWRGYEGEQLQIKDKEGNVYLTSSYNCTLIKK